MPAADAASPTSQPDSVRARSSLAAYGAPDAPVTPRKTFMAYSFGPLEASRKTAILRRFSWPRAANGGIDVFPNCAGFVT